MHGKSRVSFAIKYDCFKLDNSGNCICWDLKEHHIIIIKNQKGKISIEFQQYFICLQ